MFRFRQIKPQYLHIYEDMNNPEVLVTQDMVDQSQVLTDVKLSEGESVQVMKMTGNGNTSNVSKLRLGLIP